jgi:leucyl aminopeptidase
VNKLPWAHLDIAATAWRSPGVKAITPDGPTGYGVRLLDRLVRDHYEG